MSWNRGGIITSSYILSYNKVDVQAMDKREFVENNTEDVEFEEILNEPKKNVHLLYESK